MKLTILNTQSQKPILVMEDDVDGSLKVVSGDPAAVQQLGLNRFHTLVDIAQYVNSDGGHSLQAIMDQKEPDEDEARSQDDRIEPALQIVKDLLERVKNRKDTGADPVPANQSPQEENQQPPEAHGGEVVAQKPSMIYVSYDGDGIGNAVARAEEKDDEVVLAQISQRINNGQKAAADWALRYNGVIIEQGGDEGLVKVPSDAMHHIEELRAAYLQEVGSTLTVGVGQKISESTKARMLGKLKGKDQVLVYDDSTAKELELLMQDQDHSEANKIKTALNNGGDFQAAAASGQDQQDPQSSPDQADPEPAAEAQSSPPQAAEPETQDIAVHSSFPKWASPNEQPAEPEAQPEASDQPSGPNKPQPPFSQEMINAMGKEDPKKPKSVVRNPYNDPQIEGMNFDDSEDPQFSKALQYAIRYGANK